MLAPKGKNMTMMNIDDIFDLSIWTIDNKIIICETYYHQPISDSDDGFTDYYFECEL